MSRRRLEGFVARTARVLPLTPREAARRLRGTVADTASRTGAVAGMALAIWALAAYVAWPTPAVETATMGDRLAGTAAHFFDRPLVHHVLVLWVPAALAGAAGVAWHRHVAADPDRRGDVRVLTRLVAAPIFGWLTFGVTLSLSMGAAGVVLGRYGLARGVSVTLVDLLLVAIAASVFGPVLVVGLASAGVVGYALARAPSWLLGFGPG